MKKVKWGIMGLGAVVKNLFVPALLEEDNCELYAVAGFTQENVDEFLAEFSAEKAYADYDELIQDPEVEVIYVALPNVFHKEWAVKAMKAGKHVLCEKPLAMSEAEAREMFEVAESCGVMLEEGFAYLHGDITAKVDELIEQGSIGKLKHIDVRLHVNWPSRNNIRFSSKMGGGAMNDMGVYGTSFIRHLFGEDPTETKTLLHMGDGGVDETATVAMAYPGEDRSASLYVSLNNQMGCSRTIIGDQGMILIPHFFNVEGEKTLYLHRGDHVEEHKVVCRNPYGLEARQFSDAVIHGDKPLLDADFSVGVVKTSDQILGR